MLRTWKRTSKQSHKRQRRSEGGKQERGRKDIIESCVISHAKNTELRWLIGWNVAGWHRESHLTSSRDGPESVSERIQRT